jgi:2-polyprenyl-3-methyl-5-hydroxy-6-metoxy-1,4-benzoquinol methylase
MSSALFSTIVSETPFDAVAGVYATTFTDSLIGRAQRHATWREMDHVFRPGQRVLEINCGTGIDAIHLASRGVEVLACDISRKMIEAARLRLSTTRLRSKVDFRVLAIDEITSLEDEGPFDGVLSNFAGLNCVRHLSPVAYDLARLLKPRALAVICLFGRFAAWEIGWHLARGSPRKAFRRLAGHPATAELGSGTAAEVRYYSVRELVRIFAPEFRLKTRGGVGVAVPPTYLEPCAQRFPHALRLAEDADRFLGHCPVLRGLADHILLTLERANACAS